MANLFKIIAFLEAHPEIFETIEKLLDFAEKNPDFFDRVGKLFEKLFNRA